MWKLSAELRQRLDGQRGDNSPPLSMNCFVTVRWTLNSDDDTTMLLDIWTPCDYEWKFLQRERGAVGLR